ncbi:tyrosine-type recombinase/integrase [Pelomonas sp. V22]|uniref:phage integrase family protein n=1 Tax=Pelomonas sp. V22 TaxID=2822139 RepID=UPI0024A84264|nr:phage integrase family protein [Pelomonas sp. V22]MDI4635851.1 tyrosine-type recombinase/integrase [Pelomonas sp. V22]
MVTRSHVQPGASPRLAAADFRFLTAWLQGIEIHEAWDRYMLARGPADLRRIRSTTRTLLDVLVSVAKRHGDPQVAALLRRDPGRIKSSQNELTSLPNAMKSVHPAVKSSPVPTLEQFAETLEDPDFYSQAELIELWEEQFGKVPSTTVAPQDGAPTRRRDTPENRALKRRGRLIQRQLEALKRLEVLAASSPEPADQVEAWLDAEMAKRLQAVGISRLLDLSYYVRTHGYRWYRKVPRIGEERAGRLVRWLQQHEATLGMVPVVALVPRAQLPALVMSPESAIGVVPIERLQVPYALSGEQGSNRAPADRCKAKARNDHQAVNEWLELRRPVGDTGNAHTFRAYRKEAERFLLWALFERRKALSDLDHTDCTEYRRFLSNPGPMWIGAKSAQRWSDQWRPFEGPLSARSRKSAEVIVASLCTWLVKVRYLDSNPWDMVPAPSLALPMQELRSLSDKQWDLVKSWLEERPQTGANVRLLFMFRLALGTGMREAELANAKVSWLRQDTDDEGELAWGMLVEGKGGKQREVPLTKRLAQQVFEHLVWKGALEEGQSIDDVDAEMPLLSALEDPRRPMSPARVYELMKDALQACADEVDSTDPAAAARIRKASPHWLRHTHGRKFVEAGGDRGILRQNLGHASDATTAIYDRSEARRRRRDVERVFG